MTTSWWVLVALPLPVLPADLLALLQEYTLFALPNLLSSQADTTTPTTCRLAVNGLTVSQHNPPAHGAFSSGMAVNTAAGILWRTGDPGRTGWAVTYLPGCPHDFVETGWILSAEGYNNILDSAVNFKLQLETLPSYPAQTLVLGTLLRARGGAPRPFSVFRPFLTGEPCHKVVTIRRRIPDRQAVSPF